MASIAPPTPTNLPRPPFQAAAFIMGYARSPASTVGSIMCSNLATGKRALVVDVTKVGHRLSRGMVEGFALGRPRQARIRSRDPHAEGSTAGTPPPPLAEGSTACSAFPIPSPVRSLLLAPQIEFSAIPEPSIAALIEEGEVFWCAGALMVEHPLVAPHVVTIKGGMDAVMGLGKASTLKVLREAAEP